jgi:hypothetical protein
VSAGDPDDQGFLSRWSRRKRAIAEQEASETDLAPALPQPALAAPPAPVAPDEPAPEPEMVEPPSLDLVDKDFDVAHWLRQNVPESWKLAAMRRAWETDPAIRDFENPARDYALDWNTPGGAPGYGPLTESDDVEGMVRGIFGEPPTPEIEPEAVAEATSDSMSHQLSSIADAQNADAAKQQSDASAADPVSVRRTLPGETAVNHDENVASRTEGAFAAAQNNPANPAPPARIRKRGGGATPL